MLIEKAIRILREEGIQIFFKKSFRYLQDKFQFFFQPYSLFKIKKFTSTDITESINFLFNKLLLIKTSQIPEEIPQLLQILEERKPKTILEIGTANGGTLFLFSRIASDDATLISIDLPRGRFGEGYPIWKIPLYKSFARKNQKIHLIREDSHDQETLEKVKNILNGKKIDFLFIDGDHTYEGVKKDFKMYSKLVKRERESYSFPRHSLSSICSRVSSRQVLERNKEEISKHERNNFVYSTNMGRNRHALHLNGIIALHDIVFGPKEKVGGVPKFWKEIKERNECQEIVKDWSQNGYGIGIVYKS